MSFSTFSLCQAEKWQALPSPTGGISAKVECRSWTNSSWETSFTHFLCCDLSNKSQACSIGFMLSNWFFLYPHLQHVMKHHIAWNMWYHCLSDDIEKIGRSLSWRIKIYFAAWKESVHSIKAECPVFQITLKPLLKTHHVWQVIGGSSWKPSDWAFSRLRYAHW